MNFRGKVFKFGNDVDTDVIIPAMYLVTTDPKELAAHCMEGVAPGFAGLVSAGDIMVAGKNFGCGSSREHAPIAIKASGISCIIAVSFARIFYRNSFNIGLPLLECEAAALSLSDGDEVEVDLGTGTILRRGDGSAFQAQPIPPFMQELIRDGGLMPHVAKAAGLTG